MAYQFAGFLVPAEHDIVSMAAVPTDAICRRITSPFIGVGIRFPTLIGKAPSAPGINALADDIGIAKAPSWLYMAYETRGRIDSVYALESRKGQPSGQLTTPTYRPLKQRSCR